MLSRVVDNISVYNLDNGDMLREVTVKKVAEEWEIWNEEKEVAKSEKEAKKLVLVKFYK